MHKNIKLRPVALFELIKPQVLPGVVASSVFGYLIAAEHDVDFRVLTLLCIGCALSFAGAATWNQVLEYKHDRLMTRTALRPIAAGSILPQTGALIGAGLISLGVIVLAAGPGSLTAALSVLAFTSYVFVYTPMKRTTGAAMLVGTLPGALPALGGAVAAQGRIEVIGSLTFLLLLAWQLPHFCALSWLLRTQYQTAKFHTPGSISKCDWRYPRLFALSGAIGCAAIAASLPLFSQSISYLFTGITAALGALLVATAVDFYSNPTTSNSKMMFRSSIWFLFSLPTLALIERTY